ncbi:Zn(II)2Cys6 transcription factor domain-containing protein [Aspergillus foveolatus]|uniref:Zn(II)2Cys6 transcription factor domain-containing protein n=1 Tax=Aspergillus foveolatus TaxID=210207 RepID=UPI003CCD060A
MNDEKYHPSTGRDRRATPASQPLTLADDFRCRICNKAYSRRDLRDRHRRRYIKAILWTCAQKKLRCSMTRPACSRCLQLGIQCRYPQSAVPVLHATDQGQDSPGQSLISSTSSAGLATTIEPSLLQSIPYTETARLNGDNDVAAWDAFASATVDPMTGADTFTDTFQNPDILASISWNQEFSQSSQSFGQDEEILASIGGCYSSAGSAHYPVEGQGPRTLSPENPNANSNAAMSSLFNTGSSIPNASGQSYRGFSYVGFNLNSSAQLIFASDFFPYLEAGYDTERLYEQLISTLREYSSLILQRDHWSPFVHHRFYRCSMGGMAKPMGVALACVSAYAGSFGSNYGFVDALINNERDKLVRNFQSFLDTPENCLAAVHAVCIYQTLGLFGENFPPAAVKLSRHMEEGLEKQKEESEREAELHCSFLLKMIRCLYAHDRTAIETTHDAELNWERWKFAESLRRNIFFANVINILGARAGKLSSAYFEPLHDEVVLTLPLPAPECMWRSCSLREWLEARDYAIRIAAESASTSTRPGGQKARLTQTLKELLKEEEAGTLDVSALLPLTRVILASMKIVPTRIVT